MDEARAVLERLERIESLEHVGAPPDELLAELRLLVREAEAWARRERDHEAQAVVARCAEALDVACDSPAVTVAHWDEAKGGRPDRPGLGGRWTNLAGPAGSRTVGVNRIQLDAGEVSTPAHVHGADEEIFFVLAGSGLSWQDGETYEVRAGDCLVHRPLGKAHTLRAGDDGLDVLAYGQRHRLGGAYLPKIGVYWLWPSWAEVGKEPNPFDRPPDLEWPQPGSRPDSIVNLDDVEGEYGGISKRLGATAGAKQTGLNWVALPPNEEGAPPHCHSAEEELFVILDGEGTLELWPGPKPGEPLPTEPDETHAVEPRPRRLAAAGHADLALPPLRRAGPDVSRVRHEGAERHLLLPALEQDLLPRARADRPGRAARVLRRRACVIAR